KPVYRHGHVVAAVPVVEFLPVGLVGHLRPHHQVGLVGLHDRVLLIGFAGRVGDILVPIRSRSPERPPQPQRRSRQRANGGTRANTSAAATAQNATTTDISATVPACPALRPPIACASSQLNGMTSSGPSSTVSPSPSMSSFFSVTDSVAN